MGRKRKVQPESFAEEDRRKLLEQMHVPQTSEELKRQLPRLKRLPNIIAVGKAVIYKQDYTLPVDQLKGGWVIQNPNSPGGQTGSYVVTSNSMLAEIQGVSIIRPVRIKTEQIIEVINDSEFFV